MTGENDTPDWVQAPDGSWQQRAKPVRAKRSKAPWIVVAVVLVLGVIAVGGFLATRGSTSTGPLAAPHTIGGTFTLHDGILKAVEGKPCSSKSEGYGDIREGAAVVVSDGDGKVLATGALGPGTVTLTGVRDFGYCAFPINVPAVPETAFYKVEVSHRGAQTYSLADMNAKDWKLDLSLG